jgi:phosphoserine aminotransferase
LRCHEGCQHPARRLHHPARASWQLSKGAYVHICSNETINGVEFHELPDLKAWAAMRRW